MANMKVRATCQKILPPLHLSIQHTYVMHVAVYHVPPITMIVVAQSSLSANSVERYTTLRLRAVGVVAIEGSKIYFVLEPLSIVPTQRNNQSPTNRVLSFLALLTYEC